MTPTSQSAPGARGAPSAAPSGAPRATASRPRRPVGVTATLAVDVGGSGVKAEVLAPDARALAERVRIAVEYPCPPQQLVEYLVRLQSQLPAAGRASVGFPGMVRAGRVLSAPHFVTRSGPGTAVDPDLVSSWTGFRLADAAADALGYPVRLGNDADVQGLSVISGEGLEVVLTLGTGLGSAIFDNGRLAPHLELAHHPFRKGQSYNEQVGDAARRKVGAERWTRRVVRAVRAVRALTFYDRLYIGGGNSGRLTSAFTEPATIVDNVNGILGGLRLWDQPDGSGA